MSEQLHEKLERFRNGECGAERMMIGKTFAEAIDRGERWFPKIAGEYVKMHEEGYATERAAIEAAEAYREVCRRYYTSSRQPEAAGHSEGGA